MSFQFASRVQTVKRSFVREILKVTDRPDIISFAGGLPNPDLIPVDAIAKATAKVLANDGRTALQYRTTEGYLPLRQWICDRYAQAGIHVNPDDILITTGSQQALDLLGKVMVDEGDDVIVESPTYITAVHTFGLYRPHFHGVAITQDGIDLDELSRTPLDHAKLVYCMPNFQNPTGSSYSVECRKRLCELLDSSNAVLIEDDPYGLLRFRGTPLPSLATYRPGGTALLGSFSKIVAPGLRLGWICAPKELMEKLIPVKQSADLHTDHLSQRIVHQFLLDNDFEAHLCTLRKSYGLHCDAMLAAIDRHFPREVKVIRPDGGMFLWTTLPDGLSTMKLFDLAIENKVAFIPGSAFYTAGGGESSMRLNFSNCEPVRIEEGIKRLADAIDQVSRQHSSAAFVAE